MTNDFNKVMQAYASGDISTPEIQEYLQTTGITEGTLWQSTIQSKITEGAQPAICMREALTVYKMASGTETRTIEGAGAYLDEVAEGAEIPLKTDVFTTVTFTAKKYGRRPFITNELVADSQFGVVANNIKRSGKNAENTLNRLALEELLSGAGLEYDTAETVANQGKVALSAAIKLIKDQDYTPDTAIVNSAMEKVLRDEFTSSNFGAGVEVRSTGYLGQLFGLKIYTCNVSTGNATYVWGDSNGEFMGVVYDSECAEIGMREDIHHNKWDDNDRDMVGLSVLMRMDAKVTLPNGVCRIEA